VGSPSFDFSAVDLEKGQTNGGPDALHLALHGSSMRGHHWRDGPGLRQCALDAEQPVTSNVFEVLGVLFPRRLRLGMRQEKTSKCGTPLEVGAPRLALLDMDSTSVKAIGGHSQREGRFNAIGITHCCK